jgi:hypothetical protein
VDAPGPVTVSVVAENFALAGDARAVVIVPRAGKSRAIVFRLRALASGAGRIMVDFSQDGRPLGSVDLHPEVRPKRRPLRPLLLAAVIGLIVVCCGSPFFWMSLGAGDDSVPLSHLLAALAIGLGVIWLVGQLLSARTARAEGDGELTVEERGPTPPDVIIKVFEHRHAETPGGLQFVLSSVHSALQDLPVFDGDLGTLDLRVDTAAWVEAHLRSLGEVAGHAGPLPGQVEATLRRIGQNLYEQLLPPRLQELCWTFRQRGVRSVLILSDESHIPWELIKPYRSNPGTGEIEAEDDFWGTAFALTHWLRGRPPVSRLSFNRIAAMAVRGPSPAQPAASAQRDMVLAAPPAVAATAAPPLPECAALPWAEKEVAVLREVFQARTAIFAEVGVPPAFGDS